jgi:hypothetical protein
VADRDPNVTRLLGVLESALKAGDLAQALEYLDALRAELEQADRAVPPVVGVITTDRA